MRKLPWNVLALPIIAILGACSSAPEPTNTGTIPPIEENGIRAAGYTLGDSLTGPLYDPATFPDCGKDENGVIQASWVVRMPDDDGSHYGVGGGYLLPFPTPWLSNADSSHLYDPSRPALGDSGLTCAQLPDHCLFRPAAANFETAINNNINGINPHHVKVWELIKVSDNPNQRTSTYQTVHDHQWFYNGTQDTTQTSKMKTITGNYPGIGAHMLKCVYIFQPSNVAGEVFYTGLHAPLAQAHDPINWPN